MLALAVRMSPARARKEPVPLRGQHVPAEVVTTHKLCTPVRQRRLKRHRRRINELNRN